ncbi:hypothetical protein SHJG_3224 [Streptomyces hygroscopicus subsp. jinggangensis 5008]|nr:hypothetical protein SHJG_3224 [Streptomyces hygroscopicus subsp. jinggangensis 5008]AGF62654.1 hypothetical protein SHJGH_2988 [Streptomyces hygroscopicus subsp. jinggangensis TL01]
MVAVWGCDTATLPGVSGGAVAAVRGFSPTGPRATSVSAPGRDGSRPLFAPARAQRAATQVTGVT